MCVSFFVSEKCKHPDQIKLKCEETIVAGVWGDTNTIALHVAVNPGEHSLDELYVLAYNGVSDARVLNDTWGAVDNPFSLLFRMVPDRIVEKKVGDKITIAPSNGFTAPNGIFMGEGVITSVANPPKIKLQGPTGEDDEKHCLFSIVDLEFEGELVQQTWNFFRLAYIEHNGRIVGKQETRWPMYGPKRVREKCWSAYRRLQSEGVAMPPECERYCNLASNRAVDVDCYSIQFVADSRHSPHLDRGDLYDLAESDEHSRNILRELIPPGKRRRSFQAFTTLVMATSLPAEQFLSLAWTQLGK